MRVLINIDELSVNTRIGIAEETTCPKVLEKLSDDTSWRVRELVARNENTDLKTLEKLADDEDYDVKYAAVTSINARHKH